MKRRFDYAVILIEQLKKNKGNFVEVRQVAQEFSLPRAYLGKIAQELKRAGWLEARRGAGGGYRLLKDPAGISVETLINFYEPIYSFCPVLRAAKKI